MRITLDCPDDWKKRLEEEALKDGHRNLSAVCRKAISLFLGNHSSFIKIKEQKNDRVIQHHG